MKKLATIALTGALAVTGLGLGAVSDSPVNPFAATQASAADLVTNTVTLTGVGSSLITGTSEIYILNSTTNHEGRTGTWNVKQGSTAKASGSFSLTETRWDSTLLAGTYTSGGKAVNVSSFANGTYTMTFSYTAGGQTYTDSATFTVSGGRVASITN